MKNFLLKLLTIAFTITLCLGVFIACNGEQTPPHTHDYQALKSNESSHWLECECGDKINIEYHRGGIATETQKAVCEVCFKEYGSLLPHIHNYATLKSDENNHWNECECGAKNNVEAHKGGTATCTELAKCSTCNEEYGELKDHEYNTIKNDTETHWKECECGAKNRVEEHKGGNATCLEKAKCEVCSKVYGSLEDHKYLTYSYNNDATCTANGTETAYCEFGCGESDTRVKENSKLPHEYTTLKYDSEAHWKECSCGAKNNIEAHNPGAAATETTDQTCTICNYVINPSLGHVHNMHLTKVDAKPQSCTKEGNIEYYVCSCNKWFLDNTATTEILDKSSVIIEKDSHKYTTLKYDNEIHWKECKCGAKNRVEEHKGGNSTCLEKAKCEVCSKVYGSLEDHKYLTYNYNNDATCTANGTETAYCEFGCGESDTRVKENSKLPHEYKTLKYDSETHWNECECGAKDGMESHKGGTATCIEKAKCEVCNEEYGSFEDHKYLTYNYNNDATCTANGTETAYCEFGCGESDTRVKENSKLPHEYTTLKYDSESHWKECECGAKDSIEEHKGGTATCTKLASCEVCSTLYGELEDHTYSDIWTITDAYHYIEATCGCDIKKDYGEHSADSSGFCTACDKPISSTEGLLYDLSSDRAYYEVIGYSGVSKKVNIVAIYNGLPVKTIYDEAFKNSNITTVIIPDSVESIGDSAFYNCKSLKNIKIPDSVISIGRQAFYGCSSLASVVIGDSVTNIGYNMFYGCNSLISVEIGDSVTSIDANAFAYCPLTSISIPDGVVHIGGCAFYNCSRLINVTFSENIKLLDIDSSAFTGCVKLITEKEYIKYVKINNNPYYLAKELTNKNFSSYIIQSNTKILSNSLFAYCGRLVNVVIPDSVTSIGVNAFYDCSSLQYNVKDNLKYLGNNLNPYLYLAGGTSTSITSATIDSNCRIICDSAFYECYSLTSIVIPDSVTIIGGAAFYNCSSLTSIEIGDSVTSIGDYAFAYCQSLTSVVIPDSVTTIGDYAFASCYQVTIYCEAESKPSGWDVYWNKEEADDFYCKVVWGYKGENN